MSLSTGLMLWLPLCVSFPACVTNTNHWSLSLSLCSLELLFGTSFCPFFFLNNSMAFSQNEGRARPVLPTMVAQEGARAPSRRPLQPALHWCPRPPLDHEHPFHALILGGTGSSGEQVEDELRTHPTFTPDPLDSVCLSRNVSFAPGTELQIQGEAAKETGLRHRAEVGGGTLLGKTLV